MPVIKRSVVKRAIPKKGMKPVALVELPTVPREPSDDLNEYHFLIHGEKKIGKTTLVTAEEGVFLLTFDPIQKALKILQAHCPDWKTFMQYLVALEAAVKAGNYPYKRIVVDGADMWYRACQTWAEKKLVVDHISEEKWGRGWDLLKGTFADAVDRLLALPGGCWFVSHSAWKEIETRHKDRKIEKLLPNLKAGGEEILVGKVDGWFAYDYIEGRRVLIILGDERTGAGNRCRGHFLTPDGRRVAEIPMGENEFEAWENFKAAFDNQQTFVDIEERFTPRKEAAKSNGSAKKKLVLKRK